MNMNNATFERRPAGHTTSIDPYWISLYDFVIFRRKPEARRRAKDLTVRQKNKGVLGLTEVRR